MPQDILITPGSGEPQILFRGSGIRDTSINLNVISSYQSASTSGTALLFEGTEGQLFAITDNLSSGTIFAVGDYTGLPIIDVDASGIVSLSRYGSVVDVYNALQIKPSGFGALDMSPVRFYGTGVNFIALRGPASIPTNTTFTLPSGDGQNGQMLFTNGAGQLNWLSLGSGLSFANNQLSTGGTGVFSRLLITSDSVVNNTVQIRAASLQASNLTEWQNNTGTVLSSIDSSGTLKIDSNPLVATSGILYIDNNRRVVTTPNITFSNTNIASPKLIFTPSGTTTYPIGLNILTSSTGSNTGIATLSFEGSAGQLFSITDVLDSGVIFSVNDIGGLPLIEADASGVVSLARYGTSVDVYEPLNLYPSGSVSGAANSIRFYESTPNGTNYVGFKGADNITGNITWVLPSGDGTSNQVLTTNGAGVLSWATASGGSSSGATGPIGATGFTGSTGPQGNQGATGVQGIQGNQGATGVQGIQGNQGATGVQGIQGNQGATGVQGIQGNEGATGVQGIQGNQGATGVQGIQGNQGATGVQGIQGNEGATGVQGIQGNQGATGVQGIQGNQGATGIWGATGFTGSTGPQGNQGATGPGFTKGSTGINFGAFPGSNEASVTITGQSSILSTNTVFVYINGSDSSADHTANDHKYIGQLLTLTASTPVDNTGFTIYGRSLQKLEGTFIVRWVWS